MWRVACSGGSAPRHVVSTRFTRAIDDKCHQPKNLPPQQEAQQKKCVDLPLCFTRMVASSECRLVHWRPMDSACDASINLEDLQIPFNQEGDLLLGLVF